MAALLAEEFNSNRGCTRRQNRRIGLELPMTNIAGIRQIVKELDDSTIAAHYAAEAIMTSDTQPKEIAGIQLGVQTVARRIAKGAGMIQPGIVPPACDPRACSACHHARLPHN